MEKKSCTDQKGTILIETYSWERMEGVILDNLKKKLIEKGIKINPNNPEVEKQIFEKAEINKRKGSLVTLLNDFLNIYKEGQYNMEELSVALSKIKLTERNRYESFLEIFYEIFNKYQFYLKQRQEIDFADMIKIGTKALQKNKYITNFKRIIVDEYQDISRGRYRLLKELILKQSDCRIMCVGDDWQSIYAFGGSDIKYTFDFEKIFGKAARIDLDKSFRFSQPILDVSSRFIQKNPLQLKKKITLEAKYN